MTQQTPTKKHPSSRISGFYQRKLPERVGAVAQWAGLSTDEQAILLGMTGLNTTQADQMIENVIGTYALPMGIAVNFLVNGQDYLIPMVVEEPSVVAACSFAARLIRDGGGFTASHDAPVMIGQIQLLGVENVYAAAGKIWEMRDYLFEEANKPELGAIVKMGGGARDIQFRPYPESPVGPMLIIHLLYNVLDAMGANTVNTACERIAPIIAEATGGRVNLRILSNLADHRKARSSCTIPPKVLAMENFPGEQVVDSIVEAGAFAEIDPYRAATHNKGAMNGMDAVCIATGNDWRALEAGVHSYAARSGQYRSVTSWTKDEKGNLCGRIEVPIAVGTVGGATRVHPTAKVAMKILDVSSASELAEVVASVGLAQNFAAIRALATEGIQRGHMTLHARQVAIAAGASSDMVDRVVDAMVAEHDIRLVRAQELVAALKGDSAG